MAYSVKSVKYSRPLYECPHSGCHKKVRRDNLLVHCKNKHQCGQYHQDVKKFTNLENLDRAQCINEDELSDYELNEQSMRTNPNTRLYDAG